MAVRKTISNTFTVTTVEDGVSQPSYIETQEAWSDVASVANDSTEPTPNGGWYAYTPSSLKPNNGGKWSYLWRRSRRMDLNTTTRQYVAATSWVYTRLSGTNGTSIDIKGHVDYVTNLPTSHSDGDAYVVDENGHLYMWSDESNSWIDIGLFQGESGVTYYTHIAWATDVTLLANPTTKANASSVTGFTITPNENCKWMGVLVDTNVADSTTATDYTWSYTKGVGGTTYFMTSNVGSISVPSGSTASTYATFKLWKRTGDGDPVAYSAWIGIYRVSANGTKTRITYASNQSQVGTAISISSSLDARSVIAFAWPSAPSTAQLNNETDYIARFDVPVVKDGAKGDGNVFISLSNSNDTVVVDDGGNVIIGADGCTATLWESGVKVENDLAWAVYYDGHASSDADSLFVDVDSYATDTEYEMFIAQSDGEAVSVGTYPFEVRCTHGGKTYIAIWNVKAIKGISKYSLLVTPAVVSYNASTDAVTPSTVAVRVQRTDISGSSNITALPTNYKLRYSYDINVAPTISNTYQLSFSGGVANITVDSRDIDGQGGNGYRIVLFDNANNILDIQDVSVAMFSDGAKGSDAYLYSILTSQDTIVFSGDSTILSTFGGTFYRTTGTTRTTANLYYVIVPKNGSGAYPTSESYMYAYNQRGTAFSLSDVFVQDGVQAIVIFAYTSNAGLTQQNYYEEGRYLVKKEIPIIKNGTNETNGERGQIGRSPYYNGLWSDYASTEQFHVTDAETPYYAVEKSNRTYDYWIWIGDNGDYYHTSANAPSNNNANWRLMVTDFKYLISEAVFSDFAKLGAGIFNQDWMYSQYGEGTTLVWNTEYTQSLDMYVQVGNTAYRDNQSNPAYVSTANHFSVIKGRKYTVLITAKSNSGTIYLRVRYGEGSQNIEGNERVIVSSTSQQVYTLVFYAERSGEANITLYGNGTVTKIELAENVEYRKFSPSFPNSETEMTAIDSPCPVSGTDSNGNTHTGIGSSYDVTPAGIFVVAGKQYSVKITARSTTGSSGTLYMTMCIAGSSPSSSTRVSNTLTLSISSTSLVFERTIVIISSFSGVASFRAWMSGTTQKANIDRIVISPIDPFVPKAAVDWRTGYAHFGGDRTRFNPDGSGFLAGGDIMWDADGNTDVRGRINAKFFAKSYAYIDFTTEVGNNGTITLIPTSGYSYYALNPSYITASSLYTIDGISIPATMFIRVRAGSAQQSIVNILMPPAIDYAGLEVEICTHNNNANYNELAIRGGSASSGNLMDVDMSTSKIAYLNTTDSDIVRDDSNVSSVRLLAVVVDATNYGWMIVDSHNAYIGS